jgi:hypothetical protein
LSVGQLFFTVLVACFIGCTFALTMFEIVMSYLDKTEPVEVWEVPPPLRSIETEEDEIEEEYREKRRKNEEAILNKYRNDDGFLTHKVKKQGKKG